jgi:hypothetical protein
MLEVGYGETQDAVDDFPIHTEVRPTSSTTCTSASRTATSAHFSPKYVWIDLLHLFLRITGSLLGLFLEDVTLLYNADKSVFLNKFEDATATAGVGITLADTNGTGRSPGHH